VRIFTDIDDGSDNDVRIHLNHTTKHFCIGRVGDDPDDINEHFFDLNELQAIIDLLEETRRFAKANLLME
jgi:hypothetical protein